MSRRLATFAEDLAAERRRPRYWPGRIWERCDPHVILDALQRWAAVNGARAPKVADWARATADHPSYAQVREIFDPIACAAGARSRQPCKCPCHSRPRGIEIVGHNEDGIPLYLDHGRCGGCSWGPAESCDFARWTGVSGWSFALGLVGLKVRAGGDAQATRSLRRYHDARNRQMVTAGAHDERTIADLAPAAGKYVR